MPGGFHRDAVPLGGGNLLPGVNRRRRAVDGDRDSETNPADPRFAEDRRGSIEVRPALPEAPETIYHGILTCAGPRGEDLDPPPTGPSYWWVRGRPINDPGNAIELEAYRGPQKMDVVSGEMVDAGPDETDAPGFIPAEDGWIHALATNYGETGEQTHALTSGQYVEIRIAVEYEDGADYFFEH